MSLLTGCASTRETTEGAVHILATTYPVYLFTTAVTEGVDGVDVDLLVKEQLSCLHDYTLTVTDMKAIEEADVIVMNGAGLEDFMSGALEQSDATVINCAKNIALLPALEQDDQSDPHIWMGEESAAGMLEQIFHSLENLDETHREAYAENFNRAISALSENRQSLDSLHCRSLITFHDGFQYFARDNGLTILKAIEEEEGAETSAAEIREIVALIEKFDIPAIFTEKNGSDATAKAVQRETGCEIYQLDMIMSGEGTGIQPYLDAMNANRNVILEALG